jgi:acetyl-CoA synthetase
VTEAWPIPPRLNLGVACADRHPHDAVAVVSGGAELSYGRLAELSDRFANALVALGVERGDRVAYLLPQGFSAPVCLLGTWKAGAVAVPMSELFGVDAVRHRLEDSGARVFVSTDAAAPFAEGTDARVVRDGAELERLLAGASPRFEPVDTAADDPAYVVYTSGTTAAPKGALHAHRSLIGTLPGFELAQGSFPQAGDRFWTPADWAWTGGLMDALVPTLWHGRTIVAAERGRFDPERAARLILDAGIRNAFVPPTALRLMKNAGVTLPPGTLRAVISGGEVLGADVLAWAGEAIGVRVAEFYGQTELNFFIGNSPRWPTKPGSMGRPYPGHDVVLDEGEICVRLPDPVAFLGYWNAPEATAAKVVDGLLRTGDLARRDDDGYFWFTSRADDLIISAGYRISPLEIEACLHGHPAVAQAAVVGVPDDVRGQVVKAFVVPRPGAEPSVEELQRFVRERLAAYEYPRQVELVRELPQTVTGKIRRRALLESA